MIVLKVLIVVYDIVMADIRRLDPQVLLVFESLLETKSTTVSAVRLGLSQSAVSGALRRLRERSLMTRYLSVTAEACALRQERMNSVCLFLIS